MDDRARTDQVHACWRDQARREDVEVVGHGIVNDGMAGILKIFEAQSTSMNYLQGKERGLGNAALDLTHCVRLRSDSIASPFATGNL